MKKFTICFSVILLTLTLIFPSSATLAKSPKTELSGQLTITDSEDIGEPEIIDTPNSLIVFVEVLQHFEWSGDIIGTSIFYNDTIQQFPSVGPWAAVVTATITGEFTGSIGAISGTFDISGSVTGRVYPNATGFQLGHLVLSGVSSEIEGINVIVTLQANEFITGTMYYTATM